MTDIKDIDVNNDGVADADINRDGIVTEEEIDLGVELFEEALNRALKKS